MLRAMGASFGDPALEAQYVDFRVRRSFLREDGFHAGIHLALMTSAGARQLLREGLAPGTLALLSGLCWPMAILFLRARARRLGAGRGNLAFYLRWRTALVFTWRAVAAPIMGAAFFREYFAPPGGEAGGVQVAAYVALASGTVPLFFGCVSTPVLLKQHLILQPLATLAFALGHGRSFCDEALASDVGAAHLNRAWRALDIASRGVLSAMYMRDVREGASGEGSGEIVEDGGQIAEDGGQIAEDGGQIAEGSAQPEALAACQHLILSLYTLVCLVAATYIMWRVERRSRMQFLAASARSPGRGGGGEEPWRPVGPAVVSHVVFGVAASAVAWQAGGLLFWVGCRSGGGRETALQRGL